MSLTTIQRVDRCGNTIGLIEKMAAHVGEGVWHRAVSVVLVDLKGRFLLQKRADSKYHFAGLWANACCTHPSEGESPLDAGRRAMQTELGVSCEIVEVATCRYEASDSHTGLIEREYDHILFGILDSRVEPNPLEVSDIRWVEPCQLRYELATRPSTLAPWLPVVLSCLRAAELQNLTHARRLTGLLSELHP